MSSIGIKISEVFAVAVFVILIMTFLQVQSGFGQSIAISPVPEGFISGNGKTTDQGIAYTLLLMALIFAYVFH
ncbi:hypothetical protein CDL15_Pgr015449 [Punica granatum]|uniref:Uncharacterized protein n=1 Tax=Punica granatum TaxID=22663 RepID=A0A218W0E5_PUNGR|nr:hypothetical protein CDL15_Pgr015449 [Punica granatum]